MDQPIADAPAPDLLIVGAQPDIQQLGQQHDPQLAQPLALRQRVAAEHMPRPRVAVRLIATDTNK